MRQGALFGKRAADVGNKWLSRAVGLQVQTLIRNLKADLQRLALPSVSPFPRLPENWNGKVA
jgi:hypothetical protein